MTDKTSLGDRIKFYEKQYTHYRTLPLIPTIVRIDGKNFSKWCRGLDKPFDLDFVNIMERTTKALVEESNAIIGYTQSDEITLVFYTDNTKSQIYFDGKIYKMTSVLASLATAKFNFYVKDQVGRTGQSTEKTLLLTRKPDALFDCRVFQVPTKEEAVNCLIWREQDATRNSILSVGQAYFSANKLHGKNVKEIQEMLFQEHGVNWSEDFENNLKRGSYWRREEVWKKPTRLEAYNQPTEDKGELVKRHEIKRLELPILASIENRVQVIFDRKQPLTESSRPF